MWHQKNFISPTKHTFFCFLISFCLFYSLMENCAGRVDWLAYPFVLSCRLLLLAWRGFSFGVSLEEGLGVSYKVHIVLSLKSCFSLQIILLQAVGFYLFWSLQPHMDYGACSQHLCEANYFQQFFFWSCFNLIMFVHMLCTLFRLCLVRITCKCKKNLRGNLANTKWSLFTKYFS